MDSLTCANVKIQQFGREGPGERVHERETSSKLLIGILSGATKIEWECKSRAGIVKEISSRGDLEPKIHSIQLVREEE